MAEPEPNPPEEHPARPVANPDAIPDMFAGLMGAMGIGGEVAQRAGNMLAGMRRMLDEPAQPGVHPIARMMEEMIGPDAAAQMNREIQIREFLTARMAEGSIPEAIRLTKERFEIPDDYTIQVPLTISFKLPVGAQTRQPDVD